MSHDTGASQSSQEAPPRAGSGPEPIQIVHGSTDESVLEAVSGIDLFPMLQLRREILENCPVYVASEGPERHIWDLFQKQVETIDSSVLSL